jgi:hypothetical protein
VVSTGYGKSDIGRGFYTYYNYHRLSLCANFSGIIWGARMHMGELDRVPDQKYHREEEDLLRRQKGKESVHARARARALEKERERERERNGNDRWLAPFFFRDAHSKERKKKGERAVSQGCFDERGRGRE